MPGKQHRTQNPATIMTAAPTRLPLVLGDQPWTQEDTHRERERVLSIPSRPCFPPGSQASAEGRQEAPGVLPGT